MRLRLFLSVLFVLAIGLYANGMPSDSTSEDIKKVKRSSVIKDGHYVFLLNMEMDYPMELSAKAVKTITERIFGTGAETIEAAFDIYMSKYKNAKGKMPDNKFMKYFNTMHCGHYEKGRYATFSYSEISRFQDYKGFADPDDESHIYIHSGTQGKCKGRFDFRHDYFIYDILHDKILTAEDIFQTEAICGLKLDDYASQMQVYIADRQLNVFKRALPGSSSKVKNTDVCSIPLNSLSAKFVFTDGFCDLLTELFATVERIETERASTLEEALTREKNNEAALIAKLDTVPETMASSVESELVYVRKRIAWIANDLEWLKMSKGLIYKPIYKTVSTVASFPGGDAALMDFLNTNVKYPQASALDGGQKSVLVEFVVEKDGTIDLMKVVKEGKNYNLDNEALRVIGLMPKWNPGKLKDGTPIRMAITLPVTFKQK